MTSTTENDVSAAAGDPAAGDPAAGDPAPRSKSSSDTGSASRLERRLWAFLVLFLVGLVGSSIWVRGRADKLPPLPVIAEVPPFSLTHHDGTTLSREDLLGRPWVADFIFTRCIAVCPRMSMRMRSLVHETDESSPVRFVSITVDPEHDTREVLAAYAEKYDARASWYFLRGSVEETTELTMKGFLLPLDTSPPPEMLTGPDPIIHSNRFVLVDADGKIRGYYDAFDPREIENLKRDLERLSPSER